MNKKAVDILRREIMSLVLKSNSLKCSEHAVLLQYHYAIKIETLLKIAMDYVDIKLLTQKQYNELLEIVNNK